MLAHKRCVAAFLRDLETKCRSGSSSPDTETVELGEYSCVSHAGIGRTSKMCEDAQDLSYFGKADGQCEKFSILNLHCRGLHAWVEIDQSHLLP